jgi:2-haloacid dehalogenase
MPPSAVAFDVNETLFSLAPVGARLDDAGLPAGALHVWFARILRDGFAQAAVGTFTPFAELARHHLQALLDEHGRDGAPDEILSAIGELPAHDDVRPALERLRDAGVRAVTLTNGSAANTQKLLARNDLDGLVERCLDVEAVQRWKPCPQPYHYAAEQLGVQPAQLALVAVHSWDVDGAARAGLMTGYASRLEGRLVTGFRQPDVTGHDLVEVVDALLR